jgi:hypothetical protein
MSWAWIAALAIVVLNVGCIVAGSLAGRAIHRRWPS